ncbi:hypothetical protein COW36_20210 [bacterium (Candidatus Blackallbacteria) CG17_big_fil_post_rev_8_21_14_2_50_48_46]|uniref:Uncharacterized protein n=1 Tax=bacterium (Candidatus Blackallbacteria) CG17_big_fil_post_rev_8_21_14_2_50_48_46 TaxID=2014261 RepID=A0A2M7G0H8_9BACT|nr:MAG: hypothetical protein COW64_22535 [bacterium (Candidatus Blackallbacteria) CG18_big_fil_WC_8_21_14_2_50_49_26]PIW14732.1 MAG: hypothetical protein COW36_20210 [bacterium (Candidatus Blackallbacteria) CG17_big_fil_post_rev_8_21_14_2_50_48_46]PIW50834.1 MAG: hypothetical protein COW20_01025 [bacterium (Candidatus Blackallbacteria) CG13_big_fil_rev_8_21_14_2_50_49_14]
MIQARNSFVKSQRYFRLALKKADPDFSFLYAKGIEHFRDSLTADPQFQTWLEGLDALLDLFQAQPTQTWLLEVMERICLEYSEQVYPAPDELFLLLGFLSKFKNFSDLEPELYQRIFQFAEGFFQYFGKMHSEWNGELLFLRAELLFQIALSSSPPSQPFLQAATHSFLQAKHWKPQNSESESALATSLLYQACYASEGQKMLYKQAWQSLCALLRNPQPYPPRLEFSEILWYALIQNLSFSENLTLFKLLTKNWLYDQTLSVEERAFWLTEQQKKHYLSALQRLHRSLLMQLETQSFNHSQSAHYLEAWLEMVSVGKTEFSWLRACLQLTQMLQTTVAEIEFQTGLQNLAQLLQNWLEQGFPEAAKGCANWLGALLPMISALETQSLLELAHGFYLILAEMLLQGWLDEDGYQQVWLDILSQRLMQNRQHDPVSQALIQHMENAWMALIACSPDEHIIIDNRETLLELLIRSRSRQFERLLEMLHNLYAMLLNRHTCDFNLANLASYLQTLAEHRSGEESRQLLLESCQAYAQACSIAEDDTELLFAWQTALRRLAEFDPEHAQELESEADDIYRQALELLYQRS